MGSGLPIFSENTLMLYQQDLELGPYFLKLQLGIDLGLPKFPIRLIIFQNNYSGPNS